MKRITLLIFFLLLTVPNSIFVFEQTKSQRTVLPNVLDTYEEKFVMGNDSGFLSVYNDKGNLITRKRVADQEIGHLIIGIEDVIWINSTTIAYQSGPYHLGLWNYKTNSTMEIMVEAETIKSLTFNQEVDSLVYVTGNETIKWQSITNSTINNSVQAKEYMFFMGILDPNHAKVTNIHTTEDTIFFQYNDYLYRYNRTSNSAIGRYKEKLDASVVIEYDNRNQMILISQSGILRSTDYNLEEKAKWYFGDQRITSIDVWNGKAIVGFSNGDIRRVTKGENHGDILKTGVQRIDDLVILDNTVIYVSSTSGPYTKEIDKFEKEWVSPIYWINEVFWRKEINRTVGWIVIMGFLGMLGYLIIPILIRKTKGPRSKVASLLDPVLKRPNGYSDYQERKWSEKKGFVSKEEADRISNLGFATQTAYNQAKHSAQKEGWLLYDDKKKAQSIGVTIPDEYYNNQRKPISINSNLENQYRQNTSLREESEAQIDLSFLKEEPPYPKKTANSLKFEAYETNTLQLLSWYKTQQSTMKKYHGKGDLSPYGIANRNWDYNLEEFYYSYRIAMRNSISDRIGGKRNYRVKDIHQFSSEQLNMKISCL